MGSGWRLGGRLERHYVAQGVYSPKSVTGGFFRGKWAQDVFGENQAPWPLNQEGGVETSRQLEAEARPQGASRSCALEVATGTGEQGQPCLHLEIAVNPADLLQHWGHFQALNHLDGAHILLTDVCRVYVIQRKADRLGHKNVGERADRLRSDIEEQPEVG